MSAPMVTAGGFRQHRCRSAWRRRATRRSTRGTATSRASLAAGCSRAERAAEKTSELALRVLRGERPEDIPITAIDVSVDALDWRQLDRWHVSEARVPAGVELRFRQPGLFEQYRGYILTAVGLVSLQTLLIAGLLIQRRNRRRAERSLRESEERFRVMADTAPVMVWRSGPDQALRLLQQAVAGVPGTPLAGRDRRRLDGRRAPGRLASLFGDLHRRLARP